MTSRRLIILIVFLVILSAANVFVSSSMPGIGTRIRPALRGGEYAAIIENFMMELKDSYVEEVDAEELFRGAVRGMVGALNDPHSVFIEPASYTKLQEDTRGHFGGLGIVIGIREGYLTVISVMDGKPASRSGVKAGEKIFAIDGKTTLGIEDSRAVEKLRSGADPAVIRDMLGISLPEAVSRLRGPVGKPVKINVGMKEDEARDLSIVREKIDMESVSDARILEEGIGYLRISNFTERTPQLMDEAVDGLKKQGMESLIVDLRNNPGGLLHSAVRVAERFVPGGGLIVSIRGRGGEEAHDFKSSGRERFYELPLVVLVNEYSASGSEIVAAALQDLGKAVLVGGKTFGKGSVQTIISIHDGSAVKLTTSRYYSPLDRLIDNKGVEPDIYAELSEEVPDGLREDDFAVDSQVRQAVTILQAHSVLSRGRRRGTLRLKGLSYEFPEKRVGLPEP